MWIRGEMIVLLDGMAHDTACKAKCCSQSGEIVSDFGDFIVQEGLREHAAGCVCPDHGPKVGEENRELGGLSLVDSSVPDAPGSAATRSFAGGVLERSPSGIEGVALSSGSDLSGVAAGGGVSTTSAVQSYTSTAPVVGSEVIFVEQGASSPRVYAAETIPNNLLGAEASRAVALKEPLQGSPYQSVAEKSSSVAVVSPSPLDGRNAPAAFPTSPLPTLDHPRAVFTSAPTQAVAASAVSGAQVVSSAPGPRVGTLVRGVPIPGGSDQSIRNEEGRYARTEPSSAPRESLTAREFRAAIGAKKMSPDTPPASSRRRVENHHEASLRAPEDRPNTSPRLQTAPERLTTAVKVISSSLATLSNSIPELVPAVRRTEMVSTMLSRTPGAVETVVAKAATASLRDLKGSVERILERAVTQNVQGNGVVFKSEGGQVLNSIPKPSVPAEYRQRIEDRSSRGGERATQFNDGSARVEQRPASVETKASVAVPRVDRARDVGQRAVRQVTGSEVAAGQIGATQVGTAQLAQGNGQVRPLQQTGSSVAAGREGKASSVAVENRVNEVSRREQRESLPANGQPVEASRGVRKASNGLSQGEIELMRVAQQAAQQGGMRRRLRNRNGRSAVEELMSDRVGIAEDILTLLESVTDDSASITQAEFQEIVRRLEKKRSGKAGAGIQPVAVDGGGAVGESTSEETSSEFSSEGGLDEVAPSTTLDIYTEKVADAAVM